MPTDAQKLIQSLVESAYLHDRKDSRERPPPPVVTVSRDPGAGGCEIASRLGQALGVEVWDREILEAVAERANAEPELMAKLDDRVRTGMETWIYNLFSGQNAFMASYRHHLVNVVLAIAGHGGIIIGRGAHLILANRPVFRLRVVGSDDACARRLASRGQGMDYDAALAEVGKIKKEREDFMRDAFQRDVDESVRFDLVLNTDKYDDRWDEVTDLVLSAIRLSGVFPVHGGGE